MSNEERGGVNQAYFNGNYWQASADTIAGQSPATTPGSWRKIRIPKAWRLALTGMAYAECLKIDGQTEKAATEKAAALDMERTGLSDLVRLAANQEQRRQRPNVRTEGGC